ncbi:hypothetical protein [Massilia sp. TSP1-1-2]|uniref:hypothetical protein n=1 Tax=Massilia sp. TSP1-1-2 TaxID=2804649 RepID=UPI003CF9CF18
MASANTKVGLYVDGVLVGSYANTSSGAALNWQAVSFAFKGDGLQHNVSLKLKGGSSTVAASAMIEGIRLIETLPDSATVVYGMQGTPIALPGVTAQLAAADGATLGLQLLGLPYGAVLSDGIHRVTAYVNNATVNLAGWDLSKLKVELDAGCGYNDDSVLLKFKASSTVAANNTRATITRSFTVQQLSGCAVATPVGVNPYVSYANSTAVTTSSAMASAATVSALVAVAGGYTAGVSAAMLRRACMRTRATATRR